MLKSVHITNYYHKNSGGVSTSYNNLLAAANRNKRYVRLIVPGEISRVEEVGEFGKIYHVAANTSPFFDKRYRVMSPFHFGTKNAPIRDILAEEMPDLIEIYDNTTLTSLAAMIRKGYFKNLNRPMLVYFTGERLDTIVKSFLISGRLGDWISRGVLGSGHLQMFDYFIANSDFVAEELFDSFLAENNPRRSKALFNACRRFFNSASVPFGERVRVCPRGVDSKFFNPSRRSEKTRADIRDKAGIPAESIVLLSSTRISREKNVQLLPEITKILAKDKTIDFRLLIAGDGPLSRKLQDESEKYFPGKIRLIGHLDKETLADYYANADAFIHPNPREPFGNVGLEAMASGVPFVAPNSGGVLTYANPRNAWLTEPTPENFAAVIRQAIVNKGLAAQKTALALITAQSFSQEKSTDLLFAAYDELYRDFQCRTQLFTNESIRTNDGFKPATGYEKIN